VRSRPASADGVVRPGVAIARGRIGRDAPPRIVNAVLTGVHQPGESHFELMKAFADDDLLARIGAAAEERGYRGHEFGDSFLIERGDEAA
jgi:S-adenosylmethionine:tRNA ribosyltransferase-isomerase